MHLIFGICQWLEQTTVGTTIRESLWLFPIIETVHIFGIILLVGATSILDLRLMGLTFRDEPVSKLAQRFLPWAWAGFLIQVFTGLLLFSSEAAKMYGNIGFEIKMLLIVVAGTITAFDWSNPHCLVYLDAMEDSGQLRHWTLEMTSTFTMSHRGWDKDALKRGDRVIVETHPARNGAPIGITAGPGFALKI